MKRFVISLLMLVSIGMLFCGEVDLAQKHDFIGAWKAEEGGPTFIFEGNAKLTIEDGNTPEYGRYYLIEADEDLVLLILMKDASHVFYIEKDGGAMQFFKDNHSPFMKFTRK